MSNKSPTAARLSQSKRRIFTLALLACALAFPALPSFAAVIPQSTLQPYLPLTFTVESAGIFNNYGTIDMFPYFFSPGLAANGNLLSINSNQALFEQIGTAFGGDGQSNFALPNLTGKTPIGTGQGPGLPSYSLGNTPGVAQNSVILAQLPSSVGGTSQPLNNIQPSLAVNYMIATQGIFPQRDGNGALGTDDEPLIGQVFLTTAAVPPTDFLPCDGRLLSIQQNQALFSLLGIQYGGNGTTNFALPDLRGRAAVGAGNGNGLTPRAVGNGPLGSPSTTLASQNLPSPYGSSTPYSNMQPGTVLQYMIATTGLYPEMDEPLGFTTAQPYIGQISMFAGTFVPGGWLPCDGRLLLINQNDALFSLLGIQFGGDGQTTFALPDLQGRIPVGQDFGAGSWTLGNFGGTENLQLTAAQIPTIPEPASLSLLALATTLLLPRKHHHK